MLAGMTSQGVFNASVVLASSLLAIAACGDDSAVGGAGGSGGGATVGGAPGIGGMGGAPSTGGMGGETSSGGGPTGGADIAFHPAPGATWQWQLDNPPLDTSFQVEVYDIDLFDNDAAAIAALQADGRAVTCYFNAGTWEPWRPDADAFPDEVKGNPFDDPAFDEELYLDIRSPVVAEIMVARLDLARDKGCDAVEPDVVNLHEEGEAIVGFPISDSDQLQYNILLAEQAHARGLSIGLKNDLSQLEALEPHFDWALNESCWSYDECDLYEPTFIAAGKAVFHAEYVGEEQLADVCAVTSPLGLSTILKEYDLGPWRVACP